MATILRSSKHLRSIAELANKLGFSKFKGDVRVCISQTQSAPSTLARSLATQVAARISDNESNLEYNLQKLDADVKRFGKIPKAKVDRTFNVLQQSKSVTSTQALMILRCCGNLIHDELPQFRSELVNEIWKRIENLGIPLEIAHYNTLLRVYSENNYEYSPVEILAHLESKGIAPNRLTCERLISRYCEKGDIAGAGKILEFMKEKGISVNENIFAALVKGHAIANDMSSAADILSVMRQAGLEPSADTYKELLCGYAIHGDMESILRTFSECRSHNLYLLDADYLDIVYSFACNGHNEHIETILSMMPRDVNHHQECMNYIVKLVEAGHVDVAKQVCNSIPSRENGRSATASIKQLAKCNLPAETLCDMCKDIVAKGINSEALMIALEVTLTRRNVEASLALINALHESGKEIREHYFWPVLLELGSSKNISALGNLLRTMRTTYNLSISNETLQDYVLTSEIGQPEAILADLLLNGLPFRKLTTFIAINLINQSKLKEAEEFIQKHKFRPYPLLLSRPLVMALARTRDAESYVAILRQIYLNRFDVREQDDWLISSYNDILRNYLIDAINLIEDDKIAILSEVFKELPKAGLIITESIVTELRTAIRDEMTPSLSKLLNKLKYNDPSHISAVETNCRADILQLEESLKKLTSNEKIILTKERLLFLYSRIKDSSNLERIEKDLKEQGVPFTASMYKNLLNGYLNPNSLDKAEECLRCIEEMYPSFELRTTTMLEYITLLIQKDRTEDAVQFLSEQMETRKHFRNELTYEKVLNTLVDFGNPRVFDMVFNMFLQKEYISIDKKYLRLLVRVHVVSGDLQTALNVFEELCNKYNLTPYKNELTTQFIEKEDATSLQRLIDLSTKVHGESNSLHDLAVCFIRMDCLRQAKKILEIPTLRDKVHKLKYASRRFYEQDEKICLERLVSIIKNVSHLKGLPEFYVDLLKCYTRENDWKRGMHLWEQMLDEDIEPSKEFLVTLANLLETNKRPIPYKVSKLSENENQKLHLSSTKKSSPTARYNNRSETRLWSKTVSSHSRESKFEALVRNSKLNEAYEVLESMLGENLSPSVKILKLFFSCLGRAGEIQLIDNLSKRFTVDKRRAVGIDDSKCSAYINSGKVSAYLDLLEKHYETDYSDGSDKIILESPTKLLRFMFRTHPESLERYTKIAESSAAKGILEPMNTLWIYYFIQRNPIADEIWSEHMKTYPELVFQPIIDFVRHDKPALIKALAEKLESSVKDNSSKGYVYSKLIKLYCKINRHDEGIDTLRRALNKVSVNDLQRDLLSYLTTELSSKNQSLPIDIVEKIQTADVKSDEV